jgi:hypothetical protein
MSYLGHTLVLTHVAQPLPETGRAETSEQMINDSTSASRLSGELTPLTEREVSVVYIGTKIRVSSSSREAHPV